MKCFVITFSDKMLARQIEKKITEIDSFADMLPGVATIHYVKDYSIVYMSPRGLNMLGVSLDEIKCMGSDFYSRYFNSKDYVKKFIDFTKKSEDGGLLSFFQQVRPSEDQNWIWHTSCTKILLRDKKNNPVLIFTISVPIDSKHYLTKNISRHVEEDIFLKTKADNYSKLSKREVEILALIASGKNSKDIANDLHLSVETIKTHRKNIRRKLKPETTNDLWNYARAFDLI